MLARVFAGDIIIAITVSLGPGLTGELPWNRASRAAVCRVSGSNPAATSGAVTSRIRASGSRILLDVSNLMGVNITGNLKNGMPVINILETNFLDE